MDAIALADGKARIDGARCVGCGECVTVCPEEAIPPVWQGDPRRIAEKTAAFGKAVLSNKTGKALFVNCLLSITPDCDCCDWSGRPIVPDIGILASRDIVAAGRNRNNADGPRFTRHASHPWPQALLSSSTSWTTDIL